MFKRIACSMVLCFFIISPARAGLLDWLTGGSEGHEGAKVSEEAISARAQIESKNKSYKNCNSLMATGELSTDFSGSYASAIDANDTSKGNSNIAFDKDGKLIESTFDLGDVRVSPSAQLATLDHQMGFRQEDAYEQIPSIISLINGKSRLRRADEKYNLDRQVALQNFWNNVGQASEDPVVKCMQSRFTPPLASPVDTSPACNAAVKANNLLFGRYGDYPNIGKYPDLPSYFVSYAYELSLSGKTLEKAFKEIDSTYGLMGGIRNNYPSAELSLISSDKLDDDLQPDFRRELAEAKAKKQLSAAAVELKSLKDPNIIDVYYDEAKFNNLIEGVRLHCAPVYSDVDKLVKTLENNRSELLRVSAT